MSAARSSGSAPCGRFAPTPSGPLHLGSLVAALGSYLAARTAHGRWLVRIEDLDTARVIPGAADGLLQTLERHGLEWDGAVRYQSTRKEHYRLALDRLLACGAAYPCACSRRDVARGARPGPEGYLYPGTCRSGLPPGQPARAWRLRAPTRELRFVDAIHGPLQQKVAETTGDCILWRADDLPAYHLAVVVDDMDQRVTQVVRGADLLFATGAHIHLARLLGGPAPAYGHVPVVLGPDGSKLGKRTAAPGLDLNHPQRNLARALGVLGHAPPHELRHASAPELLQWACAHFAFGRVQKLPAKLF